jgi:hypothetical protein
MSGRMNGRSAKDVVQEMFRRQQAGDEPVLDDLVAVDLVNHATGPQGREGLKQILPTSTSTSGPSRPSSTTSSVTVASSRSTSPCTGPTGPP